MPTATRRAVAVARKRIQTLSEKMREAVVEERQQAVELAAEKNPRYKELSRDLKQIKKQLHAARLLVKRKAFAVRVRERKMTELPEEIKEITTAQSEVQKRVDALVERANQSSKQMQVIKDQIATKLEKDGKVHLLPDVAA